MRLDTLLGYFTGGALVARHAVRSRRGEGRRGHLLHSRAPLCALVFLLLGVASHAVHGQCNPLWQVTPSCNQSDWALAVAGDVNGDGFPDVIFGAGGCPGGTGPCNNSGFIDIVSGLNGSGICNIDPCTASLGFGHSVAAAGDVNADGLGDFIVGLGTPGSQDEGAADLYAGGAGCPPGPMMSWIGQCDDHLGRAVAGPGSLDSDAVPDIVVGIPSDQTYSNGGVPCQNQGKVRAYSGVVPGQDIWTANANSFGIAHSALPMGRFGSVITVAGDVNGDGKNDLIVGAPHADPGGMSSAGQIWVLSGANGNPLFTVNGTQGGEQLSSSAGGVGDVDGDSLADVVVGFPSSGVVKFFGSASGFSPTVIALLPAAGALSVVGVGDISGDGTPDVAVAAQNLGQTTIYAGSSGGSWATILTVPLRSVVGAADFNVDGVTDLLGFTPTAYAAYSLGLGQPNSPAAGLQVNGFGATLCKGPFFVGIPAGGTLSLAWSGPGNQPLGLAEGPATPMNATFGCRGILDIGPLANVNVIAWGLLPGLLNSLFWLPSSGVASQSFTVPLPVGTQFNLQGGVLQPASAPSCAGNLVLTAAFYITVI